jgi:predicted cupin superfamily sugar epimerase
VGEANAKETTGRKLKTKIYFFKTERQKTKWQKITSFKLGQ